MLPHSHANELGQSHRCCERPVARCEKSFEHVCLGSIHVVHSQTLPPHLMSSSCFCRYPARQSPQCHEVLGWNTMRIDAQAFYASGAQTEGHGHCMEAIPAHYSESKAAPKLCDILRLHPLGRSKPCTPQVPLPKHNIYQSPAPDGPEALNPRKAPRRLSRTTPRMWRSCEVRSHGRDCQQQAASSQRQRLEDSGARLSLTEGLDLRAAGLW